MYFEALPELRNSMQDYNDSIINASRYYWKFLKNDEGKSGLIWNCAYKARSRGKEHTVVAPCMTL